MSANALASPAGSSSQKEMFTDKNIRQHTEILERELRKNRLWSQIDPAHDGDAQARIDAVDEDILYRMLTINKCFVQAHQQQLRPLLLQNHDQTVLDAIIDYLVHDKAMYDHVTANAGTTARQAYDLFRSRFSNNDRANISTLKKQFEDTTLTTCKGDMPRFLDLKVSLRKDLAYAGSIMSDAEFMGDILEKIPYNKYSVVYTTYVHKLSEAPMTLTWPVLRVALTKDYNKKQERDSEASGSESDQEEKTTARAVESTNVTDLQSLKNDFVEFKKSMVTMVRGRGRGRRGGGRGSSRESRSCYNCGQVGHLAYQCRNGGGGGGRGGGRGGRGGGGGRGRGDWGGFGSFAPSDGSSDYPPTSSSSSSAGDSYQDQH